MKTEIWKPIPEYEGLYEVSSLGRIKSLKRKNRLNDKILKPGINNMGYLVVALHRYKTQITWNVHQIVAMSFLKYKPNDLGIVCNHKNFKRDDPRLDNLELITNRENTNKKHLKSSSKFTGVCYHKASNKWQASIYIDGKRKHLVLGKDEVPESGRDIIVGSGCFIASGMLFF